MLSVIGIEMWCDIDRERRREQSWSVDRQAFVHFVLKWCADEYVGVKGESVGGVDVSSPIQNDCRPWEKV